MKPFWRVVLLTSLFVGTTDIIAAYISQIVKTGKFPDKMLHYIAGGALGLENSMQGGFGTQLLGLSFHYFIAFSFTLLFFLAYPKIKILSGNAYIIGFLYGVLCSCFMGFIVIPMTKLPPTPFVFEKAVVGWIILGVVLGIPIAISANRYYNRQ